MFFIHRDIIIAPGIWYGFPAVDILIGSYMCHYLILEHWAKLENRAILEYNLSVCRMGMLDYNVSYEKGPINTS